ncbi:DNA-(apurinic or apyrimidinic site) lyase 2 [Tetrabaena socialis]|uniref:DNA-(Apurinic or apyrimidinic site) lyase 2 n=1 Tax=Tetrabaena socialis TaxID=47790 RepID=A0A2J7ZZ53_9CHLO|nr:DNA-(apurinic or apyrimidinic site) lyase 2 [Tetrabaena socialis]|eukprot:PNH05545.1 DNA-(apurinic or apyrimidinic site) lyase 2 [Tetrabaena socialis]
MKLKLLTWNVNGLRRIVGVFGGLARLLSELDADILCFQETKLKRSDLDRELALVDGWYALQVRLDTLLCEGRRLLLVGDLNISPHPMDVCRANASDFNHERPDRLWLRELCTRGSGGGRAAAAGSSGGRARGVGVAWQRAVGDAASCSSEEGDGEELPEAAGSSVPFVDTFRAFHPTRTSAYTCWNTSSGARVNNYGSRIDHILAADGAAAAAAEARALDGAAARDAAAEAAAGGSGPAPAVCPAWVVAADIMPELQGSDHAPAWVELELPEAELTRSPPTGPPPPLSSRLLFDLTKGQTTLQACLARQAAAQAPPASAVAAAAAAAAPAAVGVGEACGGAGPRLGSGDQGGGSSGQAGGSGFDQAVSASAQWPKAERELPRAVC